MPDPKDEFRRPGDPLYDPADPLARDPLPPEEESSNAVWGWVAGIIVVIAVLAVVSMKTGDPNMAGDPNRSANTETTGSAPTNRNLSSTPMTTGPATQNTAPERAPAANPAPATPENNP